MAKALKKEQRAKSYKTLILFLNENKTLDIAVFCSTLGKAILWNTPYVVEETTYGNEPILELSIDWEKAQTIEIVIGVFPINEFPHMPFSTMYTNFSKGNKNILGPVSFNTGGGFRNFIYLNAFGHSSDDKHITEVRELLAMYSDKEDKI